MRLRQKGAFLALALVAAAVAGSASAGATPTGLSLGLRHGLEVGTGTEQSANWAGYAVTHRRPFPSVTGRWVQPAATCANQSPTFSAFWVGLGGFSENSFGVEQTGTLANCSG